jgi:response regulator RpfG family c-di-GMP phosphodiesterase
MMKKKLYKHLTKNFPQKGIKLLKQANDPQTRNIPTIFLSGIVTKEADEEVLPEVRVGDRIYKAIAKPFSFEELMDAVKKAIH